MSAGTKSRTSEASSAVHHFIACPLTSKDIQTINKMKHTVAIDTIVFCNRTHIGRQ